MSDRTPSTSVPSAPSRLLSLDALRGFDMFWIIGAEDIVHALRKVSQGGPVNFLSDQLQHKPWEGVAFYDLIFPLFICWPELKGCNDKDDRLSDFQLALLLYYLLTADGAPLAGKWVSFADLPDGRMTMPHFRDTTAMRS